MEVKRIYKHYKRRVNYEFGGIVRTLQALYVWARNTAQDIKNNPAAHIVEASKDLNKVSKYGEVAVNLPEEHMSKIIEFFKEKDGIENIFHLLEENEVQFVTVPHDIIKRWYAAAFVPARNRIVVTTGLEGADESLIVHEIQHALQKIFFGRFNTKDICNNIVAVAYISAYNDYSKYFGLDFEKQAYDVQGQYRRFKIFGHL